jgi:hypothetical protein
VNGASGYFDSVEGTAIIIADDLSDFQFGTGAFTVEAWVYREGSGSAVFTIHQTPVASGMYLSFGSSLKFTWGSYGNGDNADNQITTAQYNNEWIHVAVVRTNTSSNGLKIYVNGVLDGTFTDTSNYANTPYAPRIGGYDQGGSRTGNDIKGYITDVRVVKGTAVYTGNFTPPTAPLTAITNTKLLVNMANGQAIDSAAQSNLTLIGGANTSTDQAKFGDTSLHVDGTNDYAYTVANNFTFGTGDFTIEFWYYGDSTQNDYLFDMRLANDNEARASVYFNSNNKLSYYTSNTTRITSTIALTDNTWTHIALVRSSAVTRFYFDGTQDNQSFSDTLNMLPARLLIGAKWNGQQGVTGYFDDFRISKMARYTSNFTAPTAPFADKGQ